MLDAIVAGAGPAGNQTALRLAQMGHRVAVIDYRQRPGDKLCTGIVGRQCFEAYSVPESLILHEARSALFVSSGGQARISRDETQAYVIDRVAFVSQLAERAKEAGAAYFTGHIVTGVEKRADEVEVTVRAGNVDSALHARCIIVASGTGTKVAEMAGLSPARDLLFASQAVISSPGLDEVHVLLPGIMPRGYFGWIVPQGNGTALLGVLGRPRDRRALDMAAEYVTCAGFGAVSPGGWRHWAVPVGQAAATSAGRAVLVGDAAGQVKPTSGGGIYYGLLSADLAAETLHGALIADDLSAARLQQYDAAWGRLLRGELRAGRIARAIFEHMDGASLLRLLHAAESTGLLKASGSFDWHGNIITRALRSRLLDTAMAPLKAVRNMLSGVV